MARKLGIQIKSWLPNIYNCYYIYESINTFEIIKNRGRQSQIFSDAKEEVKELYTVLQTLVDTGQLIPKEKSDAQFWGIVIESTVYEPTDKFMEMYKVSSLITPAQQTVDANGREVQIEPKLTVNFNLVINKLIEFSPTLKASLIGIL